MAQETTGAGMAGSKDPGATGSDTAGMTDQERDQVASKLVDRFSLWSGAAGLIPIPLVDMAAVGGVQLQMLRRLSEIYGVPFSDNLGKSVVASLWPVADASTQALMREYYSGLAKEPNLTKIEALRRAIEWFQVHGYIEPVAEAATVNA